MNEILKKNSENVLPEEVDKDGVKLVMNNQYMDKEYFIKKKIEYLLKLLENVNINQNNNLLNLVETAIEVIKDNKQKLIEYTPLKNSNGTPFNSSTKLPVTISNLHGYKLKKGLDEISNELNEISIRDDPLTDDQFKILLIKDIEAIDNIVPNEENKQKYDEVKKQLNSLLTTQNDGLEDTNISKIVQTALDVITYNKNKLKNKEMNDKIKEQYENLRKQLKKVVKKIINLKKMSILERTKNNNKELIETSIQLLSKLNTNNENENTKGNIIISNTNITPLVETSIELLSQSNNKQSSKTQSNKPLNDKDVSPLVETAAELLTHFKKPRLDKINLLEQETYVNIENILFIILKMISDNYNAFKNFINETNNKNTPNRENVIEQLQNEFQILINENLMKIEILENYIDELEKKNKLLQQDNDELTRELNDKINTIDAEIKEKNYLFKLKLDEISKLNATINNRQQQIQIGLKRIEILEKKINELTLNNDETELKNLQTSLKQKEETNIKLQNDLNELNISKEKLETENEQLTTDNTKLKTDKQNIEDDIKKNEEKYIKEKETIIEENKKLINDVKEIKESNKLYSDNMGNIITNFLAEIDNKDRQLLAITKDIVDLLGVTNNVDLKKIDDVVVMVDDLKNSLTKIKDNKDCSNRENLIGKIDNECLYVNKNNGIDKISNDDIMIEELLKENNKLKEKVKTEIANIEKNNNAKIEELRNKY